MTVTFEAGLSQPSHISTESENGHHAITCPLNPASKQILAADGINEFASLMGRILPRLHQSRLAAGLLANWTPFVGGGTGGTTDDTRGTIDESSESSESFKVTCPQILLEVLQNNETIFSQLLREGVSDKDIAETQNMLHEAIGFLRQNGSPAQRYGVEQYRRSADHGSTALVDRAASVCGVAAVIGTVASAPAVVSLGAAKLVAACAAPLSNTGIVASTAAAVLPTVAGAVCLPAQLAMAGHGALKFTTGILREGVLKGDATALQKLSKDAEHKPGISKKALTSAQELISRKRHHNAQHSIGYGGAIVVGQSLMAAGTVASLTGVGAAIGLPMVAAGAPLTVIGLIDRMVHRKKEGKLLGADASPGARKQTLHLEEIIDHGGLVAASHVSAGRAYMHQQQIVRSKLHSLVDKCLKKELESGKTLTPLERLHKVADEVSSIEKNIFKDTSLLKSDMHELKLMLSQYHTLGVFTGTVESIRERMKGRVQASAAQSKLPMSDKTRKTTIKKIGRELLKSKDLTAESRSALKLQKNWGRKDFTVDQLIGIAENDPAAGNIFSREFASNMASQIKTDSKFLRNDAVEQLVKVARTASRQPDTFADKDGNRITRV